MGSAGLSQRANHPASNLEAVHGSLFDIRCSSSQCAYASKDNFTDPVVPSLAVSEDHDISSTKLSFKTIARSDLPHCPQCQSLLRPGVVWFGEPLPMRAIDRIHSWLDGGKVDLMLVIGTSATVWPAANYIHAARVAGARVAVFDIENPDRDDGSGGMREEDWFFRGDAGDLVPELMKEVIGVVAKKTVKQFELCLPLAREVLMRGYYRSATLRLASRQSGEGRIRLLESSSFSTNSLQNRTLRRISDLGRVSCAGMVHFIKVDRDSFALDLHAISFNSLPR